MTAATMRRSPHGLTADRADPWQTRAVCGALTVHLFEADPRGEPDAHAKAVHVCTHCPVVDDCYASALARPPLGMVQAGVAWLGTVERFNPKRLRDPGCGPYCAHLRGLR